MAGQEEFSRTTRIDILPDLLVGREGPGRRPSARQRAARSAGDSVRTLGGRDFQSLLHSSYDAAIIADEGGRILDANVRALDFLGETGPKLGRENVGDVISGWTNELRADVLQALANDRFVLLQAYCQRSDGTLFPTETAVIRLSLSSGNYLCLFIRDITRRKQAEDRLRLESNAIQNAATGIAIADLNGRLEFANPGMEAIWKDDAGGGLVGRSLGELLGDEMLAFAILQAAVRGETWAGEVAVSDTVDSELFVQVSAAPNCDSEDELSGLVLSVLNVTDRKLADRALRHALDELARSNIDLEQFAYVVSHDLQAPLRRIQQFGDMLVEQAAEGLSPEGRDYVTRMQGAAGRMRDLIRSLLTLSRVSTRAVEHKSVDLGSVIGDVLTDLEPLIQDAKGHVEVADMPVIDAEPTQMRQLFQNLIGNALKFRTADEAPVVTVSSTIEKSDEGDVCRVDVADNGVGFAEKDGERIFGIFERLHPRRQYEGTGIGLAVCRRIAERHNGEIAAWSSPGSGATFTVTLPVKQQGSQSPGASSHT